MKDNDFDAQDMKGRIITLEQWQNGVNGKLGAAAKLEILWRSHVWLYCTLSACIGSALTFYIQKLVTK